MSFAKPLGTGTKNLPRAHGAWAVDGFHKTDGVLCVDIHFLRTHEPFRNLDHNRWYACAARNEVTAYIVPARDKWARRPEVIVLVKAEAEDYARRARRKPRLRAESKNLPRANGKWLADGVFRTDTRIMCLGISYLSTKRPYNEIESSSWYEWLGSACCDLDPRVNDGRIRAFLVPPPSPSHYHHPEVIVWVKDDADTVASRRKSRRTGVDGMTSVKEIPENRETVEWVPGRWLDSSLWEDDEYGPCACDEKIAQIIGRSETFVFGCRERRHPALDPKINEGKPRTRKLPGPIYLRPVVVSCVDDFEKIAAWGLSQEAAPAAWKSASDVALLLGMKCQDDKIWLSCALKEFRKDHPESAKRVLGERKVPIWLYDSSKFTDWLNGRTAKEIGKQVEARYNVTKRRREAVLLLYCILTEGGFSRERFAEFLSKPPIGVTLQPCAPVPHATIQELAKQAGVEPSKMLQSARKAIGTRCMANAGPRAGRGRKSQNWYLEAPVVIPARWANPPKSEHQPTTERQRNRGGRPRGHSKETAVLYEKIRKAKASGKFKSNVDIANQFHVSRQLVDAVIHGRV
jgi:hypothetical protein